MNLLLTMMTPLPLPRSLFLLSVLVVANRPRSLTNERDIRITIVYVALARRSPFPSFLYDLRQGRLPRAARLRYPDVTICGSCRAHHQLVFNIPHVMVAGLELSIVLLCCGYGCVVAVLCAT